MLTLEQLQHHRTAFAEDAVATEAAASVLVAHCLPELAKAVAANAASGHPLRGWANVALAPLATMVYEAAFGPGIGSCLPAEAAWAAAEQAASIVRSLPAHRPDGMALDPFVRGHMAAATLWAGIFHVLTGQPATSAAQAAGAAGMAAQSSPVNEPLSVKGACHWAELLPTLAAAIRSIASDPGLDASSSDALADLHTMCCALDIPMAALSGLHLPAATSAQLRSWAEGLTAAAQLLPVLWRLHGREQRHDSDEDGFSALFTAILHALTSSAVGEAAGAASSATPPRTASDPAAAAASSMALLQLHLRLCRLVHWLCQEQLGGIEWMPLLAVLNEVLVLAANETQVARWAVKWVVMLAFRRDAGPLAIFEIPGRLANCATQFHLHFLQARPYSGPDAGCVCRPPGSSAGCAAAVW